MKIVVAGIGYVGLSLAVLLAQENEVTAVDIVSCKVDALNNRISPIVDTDVEEYFKTKQLKKYFAFHFTTVQQTFNFDIYLPRYAQRRPYLHFVCLLLLVIKAEECHEILVKLPSIKFMFSHSQLIYVDRLTWQRQNTHFHSLLF